MLPTASMDPVDGEQVVLIADTENNRIVQWSIGASQGVIIHESIRPSCVTIGKQGSVLVGSRDRILQWSPGDIVGCIVAGGHGLGHELNQLNDPGKVVVGRDGALLILNKGSDTVLRWAPGAREGEIVAGRRSRCIRGNARATSLCHGPASLDQLYAPQSMALCPDGSVVVAESCTKRIVSWKHGATEGVLVAPAVSAVNQDTLRGDFGCTLDKFAAPTAVVHDVDDALVITDSHNHRVVRWPVGASEGILIAGGNGRGAQLTQLAFPCDALVDDDGSVIVADRMNSRVLRWTVGAAEGIIIAGGNGCGSQLNQLGKRHLAIALGTYRAWSPETHMLFPARSRSLVFFLLMCQHRRKHRSLLDFLGPIRVNEVLRFVVPGRLAPQTL